MKEETKGLLKNIGSTFALAGMTALLLFMVWFGVTFGVKDEEKSTCECGCSECDCSECENEAE